MESLSSLPDDPRSLPPEVVQPALLETLFGQAPIGLAIFDHQMVLLGCNTTWAEYIDRYTPTQFKDVIPGKRFSELAPGAEQSFSPIFERVLQGVTVRLKAMRSVSGGIESFWDATFVPLRYQGNVVGVIDMTTDVTKQVNTEKELQQTLQRLSESESLLRSVIENARHFAIYRIQVEPDCPYQGRVVLVSPSMQELLGVDDPYDFSKWFENLHPEDLQRIVDANRRSLEQGVPYNQPARIYNNRENRWRWVQTMSNPGYNSAGQLTHFDGMVIDLTEQKEAELALEEINATLEQRVVARTAEAERRRQVAESLGNILAVINSDQPLDEVLAAMVQVASQLLGANACVLHHVEYEQQFVSIQACYGLPRELQAIRGFPLFSSPRSDASILDRQPTWIEDFEDLPKSGEQGREPTDENIVIWRKMTSALYRAWLAVPLVIKDQVYGSLAFYFTQPQKFDGETVEVAINFANQTSLALENAQLQAQMEENAILAERNRLARELHDAVTQTLFSTSLIAEVLPRLWERNQAEGLKRLEELRMLTRGALAEMRTLLLELRPSALIDAELNELLRHLTNAFEGRLRLPIQLMIEGTPLQLPPQVKVAFYRIAQEALNNVSKHAEASQVEMKLQWLPVSIVLSITDDGRGFDPGLIPPERLGIGIMQERAASIRAQFNIQSAPGKGTRLLVSWHSNEPPAQTGRQLPERSNDEQSKPNPGDVGR
jgi:PAS domain S-box-containing protein